MAKFISLPGTNTDSPGGKIEIPLGVSDEIAIRILSSIFGNYPATWFQPWSGAAGAADNDVLHTLTDASMWNMYAVENRSAVAVDVQVTLDGTFNASQPSAAVELTDDVTAGGGIRSITIPSNKTGVLRGIGKFKSVRTSQAAAGTIAVGTVVGSYGWE